MSHVAAGDTILQQGSFTSGVAAGWFRDRVTGAPRLVTAAHLLAPEAGPATLDAVRRFDRDTALLSLATGGQAVARVLAAGRPRLPRRAPSLDACVAAPLARCVPGPPLRIAAARIGMAVRLLAANGARPEGTIAATDQVTHWYGSRGDLSIAPRGGQPFGIDGDSGALVVDCDTGHAVGLYIGVSPHTRFGCAHHLTAVAALFGLSEAG